MKRADLVVGVTLMHKRSKHYSGNPAKVLAVEPHEARRYGQSGYAKTTKGNGVLVEIQAYNYSTGKHQPSTQVVQLATLFGPDYETVAAADKAAKKAAEKARHESAARAENACAEQNAVSARLKAAGIQNYPSNDYGYSLTVSLADATKIAAILEGLM